METLERWGNVYLGLFALGLLLFYVFSQPDKTVKIIGELGQTGGGFIDTLQGR
jgi:hypothetical protein